MVLDRQGLARVRESFAAAAARRAARIGITGIEIPLAHGYLLNEFLSPRSNSRTTNTEAACRTHALSAGGVWRGARRISTWGLGGRGRDVADTIALATALKARGCDAVHVSSGGISPRQVIPIGPGYKSAAGAERAAATGLTTFAVGQITEPEQAEAIIASGQADAVALARAMLRDSRWV